MSSESLWQVARSWVDGGSFHMRLVVRFMIFTGSVRNTYVWYTLVFLGLKFSPVCIFIRTSWRRFGLAQIQDYEQQMLLVFRRLSGDWGWRQQERQYNIMALSCKNYFRGKIINIKYLDSVCMCVALCTKHAKRMRHIICGLSGSNLSFHITPQTP
jgi:hypothetical protein